MGFQEWQLALATIVIVFLAIVVFVHIANHIDRGNIIRLLSAKIDQKRIVIINHNVARLISKLADRRECYHPQDANVSSVRRDAEALHDAADQKWLNQIDLFGISYAQIDYDEGVLIVRRAVSVNGGGALLKNERFRIDDYVITDQLVHQVERSLEATELIRAGQSGKSTKK